MSDELMLSSIIAGLTSAWYDVNDLGLSHILGSQILLSLWLQSQKDRLKYQQTFILGAYVYWFMISAFVAGDPWATFHYLEALQQTVLNLEMSHDVVDDADISESSRKVFPHPLTGFSIHLYLSIGKVGSLCRFYHSANQPEGFQGFLDGKVQSLEAELLDLFQPKQSNFQNPQDPETSIDEILKVGEAYRCAGLLQLYATFPQLLYHQTNDPSLHKWQSSRTSSTADVEMIGSNCSEDFTPSHHNFLRALAFHILRILETIPATSGTRVLRK